MFTEICQIQQLLAQWRGLVFGGLYYKKGIRFEVSA